jgi:hypothetical protein
VQIAPPDWLPDARRELEALIREARWRQRRRWLAAGAAVLMVCAGAAAVIADSGAGARPRPPGRHVTVKPAPSELSGVAMPAGSSVRLLLTGPRPAWFWLATGHAEPIKGLPWDRWGYGFGRVVGGWSAQPGTFGPACSFACAAPPPPSPIYFIADGSPRAARIARGNGVAASDGSSAVWLITYQRIDATTSDALALVQVTTGGRPLGPRYRLPAGYDFGYAVGGDFLLDAGSERGGTVATYELWDPVTRRVVRTFGDVIAAGPQAIAWGPICPNCPVHVLSPLTGTTATIPLPRGTWASFQATFSSDGRYLAFPLWAGVARDGSPTLERIAVIDLISRRLLIVPGSTLSGQAAGEDALSFGWEPRGHQLIAVLPGSGETIQVASWQPGQARLWVATTQIPPGTSPVLGGYGS